MIFFSSHDTTYPPLPPTKIVFLPEEGLMADCAISSTSGFNENSREPARWFDNVGKDATCEYFPFARVCGVERRTIEKAAVSFHKQKCPAMARAKIRVALYILETIRNSSSIALPKGLLFARTAVFRSAVRCQL